MTDKMIPLEDVNKVRNLVLTLEPGQGGETYGEVSQMIDAIELLASELKALSQRLENDANYMRCALILRKQGGVMPIYPPSRTLSKQWGARE